VHLSDAHKALLITILLSSSVVLMAFNMHLQKKNELAAETYYEVLPEDYVLEEEQEKLDDILESLDKVLATNKAFNESKTYEKLDENDFEETMEKLQNRNADSGDDLEDKTYETSQNESGNENFDEINDIISKRSQKNRGSEGSNKNSTMSYSLVNRELLNNPTPIYLCERGGKIVINIEVDSDGVVTDAKHNAAASSSNNGCLIDHAIEYAQAAQFSADSKALQIGTITFFFRGKQ